MAGPGRGQHHQGRAPGRQRHGLAELGARRGGGGAGAQADAGECQYRHARGVADSVSDGEQAGAAGGESSGGDIGRQRAVSRVVGQESGVKRMASSPARSAHDLPARGP